MREALFLAAAVLDFEVRVVVIPVAGELPASARPTASAPSYVLAPVPPALGRARFPALLADPAWRARVSAASPLPARSHAAPPTLAGDVVHVLGWHGPAAVHVTRAYLAPLGVAVAERLRAPWATIDLDDDDEAMAAAAGDEVEAGAYHRVVGVFAPLFDRVSLAAPAEAAAVSSRHGVDAVVLPNAVAVPVDPQAPGTAQRPGVSVLFVGNLSYPPNAEAASLLVDAVLPQLRRDLDEPVTVTLVGPGGGTTIARLGTREGVRVTGFVQTLAPYYRAADVVVAPLQAGAGTRIKLLEAFAHRVPVVTTPAGAAGLEVTDGVHLLLAEGPGAAARAVVRLRQNPAFTTRMVDEAEHLVRRSYSYGAVTPLIRSFFRSAAITRRR